MLKQTKYFISERTITEWKDNEPVWGWRTSHQDYDTAEEAQRVMESREASWQKYLDKEIANATEQEVISTIRKMKKNNTFVVVAKKYDYKYASHFMYSDVKAYEIVKVISDKTIEVRPMAVKHDISHLEQVAGGFSGHVVDQRNQKVTYSSDPEAATIRIRKKKNSDSWTHKGNRFELQEKPYAFHDYNF